MARRQTACDYPLTGEVLTKMAARKSAFLADWYEALFIHFRLDPELLASHVPFELDLFDGQAYVSLVAFTQRRLRPCVGGGLGAWLSQPLAAHEFLNLRTYVRAGNDAGIYFVAEWIPNRLAVLLGPMLYGLPYRLGRLRYRHDWQRGKLGGCVRARDSSLRYRASIDTSAEFASAEPGSLDHFLVERYTAYTCHRGICRRFRVEHLPWPQVRVNVVLNERDLPATAGGWFDHAELIGGNFSPGVCDVGIGPPEFVRM